MDKKQKVYPLFKENYLAIIQNSIGTKMFRNFHAKVDGKRQDITENGKASCAYFVSSVLLLFGLIKTLHLTVNGLVKDMEQSGWRKIKRPRRGAVLIWEKKEINSKEYRHVGFFISNSKTISNSFKKKTPSIHHWTFKGRRKIEATFWHRKIK